MHIKSGLSFDEKQKQLVGSKIEIDFKFILDNPDPNKQVLNKIMVHECEVLCIITAYKELSIAYAVNHLTKATSGEVMYQSIPSVTIIPPPPPRLPRQFFGVKSQGGGLSETFNFNKFYNFLRTQDLNH